MEVKIGPATLELVEGDITRQDTEAIVNAANSAPASRRRGGWRHPPGRRTCHRGGRPKAWGMSHG